MKCDKQHWLWRGWFQSGLAPLTFKFIINNAKENVNYMAKLSLAK